MPTAESLLAVCEILKINDIYTEFIGENPLDPFRNLDEENFDEIEVAEHVPESADFGIYVSGDSMEPKFHDSQLVWIERAEALESGEIGLFFLDGMTYIKKYVATKAGTFLVSK